LQKRLRTSAGAEPHTTFEKKLSILKGEVFFLDKDLLMGADHAHSRLRLHLAIMLLGETGATIGG
jgi:hypothetical protein